LNIGELEIIGGLDIGICQASIFNPGVISELAKMEPESIVVLVTCGSEDEAVKIARALVEERLAACVNLVSPIRSIYRWEGKIWDEREWLLVIKTQKPRFEELGKRVKSLHSYSVPEIIGLPIVEGSLAYLDWIRENTK
jgi:periplasmic divalent cation tolerance protein